MYYENTMFGDDSSKRRSFLKLWTPQGPKDCILLQLPEREKPPAKKHSWKFSHSYPSKASNPLEQPRSRTPSAMLLGLLSWTVATKTRSRCGSEEQGPAIQQPEELLPEQFCWKHSLMVGDQSPQVPGQWSHNAQESDSWGPCRQPISRPTSFAQA
jgi:hypothetical protein